MVALYSLLRAIESGRQGALMAPTEVLAEQHFLTIEGLCAELGIRIALLTSALGARERGNVRQLIASGDVELASTSNTASASSSGRPSPETRHRTCCT